MPKDPSLNQGFQREQEQLHHTHLPMPQQCASLLERLTVRSESIQCLCDQAFWCDSDSFKISFRFLCLRPPKLVPETLRFLESVFLSRFLLIPKMTLELQNHSLPEDPQRTIKTICVLQNAQQTCRLRHHRYHHSGNSTYKNSTFSGISPPTLKNGATQTVIHPENCACLEFTSNRHSYGPYGYSISSGTDEVQWLKGHVLLYNTCKYCKQR